MQPPWYTRWVIRASGRSSLPSAIPSTGWLRATPKRPPSPPSSLRLPPIKIPSNPPMHKMNHLIEKQVLEIETGSPVKDWHFQRQLREWYYEELLPRMEQLFDRYGGKDQLIRLDSCSIEVRISDNDRWQEELSHALVQQL